jgi:hypothetical protein
LSPNRGTLIQSTVARLAVYFAVFMAYAGLWRVMINHPQWHQSVPVLAAGLASGFVVFVLALSTTFSPSLFWRDRLFQTIPELFGAAGLMMLLFVFPGSFCRLWFTGFLVALPMSFVRMSFATKRASRQIDQTIEVVKRDRVAR